MPPKTHIEVFLKISSLKLKEEIEELYIYKDCIREEYSFYYNDEIKFPLNLEKSFMKKAGKTKTFFKDVEDIETKFNIKEDLVQIIFKLSSY